MADEIINYTAWLLAAVGAINWGAEEALEINLVTDTIGLAPEMAGAAYLVIGIAGVVNLYQLVEEVA